MCVVDSELRTINPPQESSPSSVQCLWDWMRDGIRSNSICPISQGELMDQIILKLWGWQYTQIVESEEYTFLIDFTAKRNSHLNLNCFCPYRNNSDFYVLHLQNSCWWEIRAKLKIENFLYIFCSSFKIYAFDEEIILLYWNSFLNKNSRKVNQYRHLRVKKVIKK